MCINKNFYKFWECSIRELSSKYLENHDDGQLKMNQFLCKNRKSVLCKYFEMCMNVYFWYKTSPNWHSPSCFPGSLWMWYFKAAHTLITKSTVTSWRPYYSDSTHYCNDIKNLCTNNNWKITRNHFESF